jgi:hypothetical protein
MTTILESPSAPATTLRPVLDNAQYAWSNSPEAEVVLASLPGDFVYTYRDLLTGAAVALLEPILTVLWKRAGYEVTFVPWSQIRSYEVDRGVPDETCWQVWDKAISQLEGTILASAAELNDELNGYKEGDD